MAQITKVSVNIRYSQDTGHGAWKVVELGAEGTVDTKELWQQAQAHLYSELSKQLKTLWAANGQAAAAEADESHGDNINGTEPTTTIPQHFCQEHQREYTLHRKGAETWYSHRDGSDWCREVS